MSNPRSDLENLSTNNSLGDNISIDTNFGQSTLEHNVKYEKLVQDYVKLRSKLSILKKAYVELSESSIQKDQSIRKYEQEIEGLSFRNQQLTVRVEILQKELDTKTSPSSYNNSNPQINLLSNSASNTNLFTSSSSSTLSNINQSTTVKNQQPAIDILAEELQHKINENQQLHRRLNELEVDLRQKLVKNEQSLKQIEYEKLLLEKKIESQEIASKSIIEKLENDKIKLELNLIQLENQLRRTHQEKEMKETELLRKESEHNLFVQKTAELHKNSSSSSLNNAVSPVKNENLPQASFINSLKILVDSLSKIFSCLDERLNIDSKIKAPSKLANKCEKLISQIETKFKSSTADELESSICEFFHSVHKLFESIINDLASASTTQDEPQNNDMEKVKKKIKIYLNKIDQFLFSDQNSNECFSFLIKKLFTFFKTSSDRINLSNEKLLNGTKNLIDNLDKLLFSLNEKLSLEYFLEYPTTITTCDECLVSYLTQFKQSFSELINVSNSINLNEILIQIKTDLKEELAEFELEFELSLDEDNSKNKKEIEILKKNLLEKDSELNEVNEKYENLRIKSEKDRQDLSDLRARLEKLQVKLINFEENEKSYKVEIQELKNSTEINLKKDEENLIQVKKKVELIVTDAELDNKNKTGENIEKQIESSIIDTYEDQIETLTKKIQYLDSKAIFYYEEMKCLLEKLKIQIDTNNLQGHDLSEIKDQLDRTRSSYELQMSTMSDHLIEMSDRMSKQAEENEKLKHELNLLYQNSNGQSSQVNLKNTKNKKQK